MLKKDLRIQYKAKRNALSDTEKNQLDKLLLEQFKNLHLNNINYFMDFKAISKFNEPDISIISEQMLLHHPKCIHTSPRVISNTSNIEAVSTNNTTIYNNSKLAIPEPINGNIIEPELLDLLFVPLLIFDQKGYRVGYGKGMYDSFIKKCKPNVLKIGISYFEPIETICDLNDNDEQLSMCITPHKIYYFI